MSSLVPFDVAVIAVTYVVPGSRVWIVPAGTVIGPLHAIRFDVIVADAVVVQGRSNAPVVGPKTLTPASVLVMLSVSVPVKDGEFVAAALQISTTPSTGAFVNCTVFVID